MNDVEAGANKGFSLIEIVIAIGIVSVALVGILGLFPVAINAATESQRETQAALMARSIFSDLRSTNPANSYIAKDKEFDPTSPSGKIKVNLTSPQKYVVAYNVDGAPIGGPYTGEEFESGVPDAAYAVQVEVATNNLPIGVSHVNITVAAPGMVPRENRQNYIFASYLDNGASNALPPAP